MFTNNNLWLLQINSTWRTAAVFIHGWPLQTIIMFQQWTKIKNECLNKSPVSTDQFDLFVRNVFLLFKFNLYKFIECLSGRRCMKNFPLVKDWHSSIVTHCHLVLNKKKKRKTAPLLLNEWTFLKLCLDLRRWY